MEKDTLPDQRENDEVTEDFEVLTKQFFLKSKFNKFLDRDDSPLLFDRLEITYNKKSGNMNGAMYRGKKIFMVRNGKIEYSTNPIYTSVIKEVEGLVELAKKNHEKKAKSVVEESLPDINVSPQLASSVSQDSLDTLQEEIENREEEILSSKDLKENELRVIRGISRQPKNMSDEEKLEYLKINNQHWKERAEKEKK